MDSSSKQNTDEKNNLYTKALEKFSVLNEENKKLNDEIVKLQDEVKSLKEKLIRVENDYQSLDEKYQNLKIAKVIGWDQESKKTAINKIHGMVRDIDYCISFLKNK